MSSYELLTMCTILDVYFTFATSSPKLSLSDLLYCLFYVKHVNHKVKTNFGFSFNFSFYLNHDPFLLLTCNFNILQCKRFQLLYENLEKKRSLISDDLNFDLVTHFLVFDLQPCTLKIVMNFAWNCFWNNIIQFLDINTSFTQRTVCPQVSAFESMDAFLKVISKVSRTGGSFRS
jgi:hypothetical protein